MSGVLSNPQGDYTDTQNGAPEDALPAHRCPSPRRPSFLPPSGLHLPLPAVKAMSHKSTSALPRKERRSSWVDLETPLQYLGFLTVTLATSLTSIAVAGFLRYPLVSVAALAILAGFCLFAFTAFVWMAVRRRTALDALRADLRSSRT